MSRTSDTLKCPDLYDADTNDAQTCLSEDCVFWDLSRGECLKVAALLAAARKTDHPVNRTGAGA